MFADYWPKILKDGAATINEGADGLQRLDKVVAAASKYDLKVLFTLTNNWNPERKQPSVSFKRHNEEEVLPRAYLSNDYGTHCTTSLSVIINVGDCQ